MVSILQNESVQRGMYKAIKLVLWFFLLLWAFLTLFPFIWSTILSTHDRETMFAPEISLAFGDALVANYHKLVDSLPFWSAFFNSMKVAILGTVFSVLFCSMCGYALAVFHFKGRNLIFGVMIATMMIPPVLTLIPYYFVISSLGLVNTHIAVWLPFTINPMAIFLVRQYVTASVPKELLEAAKLDGAGEFRTYFTIVLPLLKPALATVAIIQFVMLWNNYLQPLVILTSSKTQVLTQALRSLQDIPNAPWGAIMLGTTLSILPLFVIYLFASRQMISGLTSGAVKS